MSAFDKQSEKVLVVMPSTHRLVPRSPARQPPACSAGTPPRHPSARLITACSQDKRRLARPASLPDTGRLARHRSPDTRPPARHLSARPSHPPARYQQARTTTPALCPNMLTRLTTPARHQPARPTPACSRDTSWLARPQQKLVRHPPARPTPGTSKSTRQPMGNRGPTLKPGKWAYNPMPAPNKRLVPMSTPEPSPELSLRPLCSRRPCGPDYTGPGGEFRFSDTPTEKLGIVCPEAVVRVRGAVGCI